VIAAALLSLALANASLAAAPAHLSLTGADRHVLRVTTAGPRLAVDVSVAAYALDLHGRPRILAKPGAPWLTVRPRRAIATGDDVVLTVRSKPAASLRAGDHQALVLLTASAPSKRGLVVRMRIGVVVTLRVPGAVARRVELQAVRVRKRGRRDRLLELWLANRGDVNESIGPRQMLVTVLRRGRVLARLRPAVQQLLPRSRGIAELRYRGTARGRVTVRVELLRPAGRRMVRAFALRL
jgi:hypothetical protein